MSPLIPLALALAVASASVPPHSPTTLSDAPIAIELAAADAPATAPLGLMLEPGLFHGGEVPAPSETPATGWLALVADHDQLALVPAGVQARLAFDPIIDAPGRPTGVEVMGLVDLASGEPVLVLHGLPLQVGPVAGGWPSASLLTAGTSHRLPAAGAETRLVVTDGEGVVDLGRVDERSGIQLLLQREQADGTAVIQHLDALPAADPEGGPYLLWAGDLDRDGHADLLLELDTSYNRSRTVLLLSSLAAPGELVGVAAVLDTTGC